MKNTSSSDFALRLGDAKTEAITFDPLSSLADPALLLQNKINTMLQAAGKSDLQSVAVDARDGVWVYTLTFAENNGDVRELEVSPVDKDDAPVAGLTGIADNGKLVADATFTVMLKNGEYKLAGGGTVRTVDAEDVFPVAIPVTIAKSVTDDNDSLADLRDDVQRAINAELQEFGLGFLTADNELTTGAVGIGDTATADGEPPSSLKNDIDFTLIFEQQVASGTTTSTKSTELLDTNSATVRRRRWHR